MQYFCVKPQVPGGFGESTEFAERDGKRIPTFCHLVFEMWPDAIVKNIMAYAVSGELRKMLEEEGITGVEFRDCLVTKGDQFDIASPHHSDVLPRFFQLVPVGQPGLDDVGRERSILVVSQKVKNLIEVTHPTDILIEPYNQSQRL